MSSSAGAKYIQHETPNEETGSQAKLHTTSAQNLKFGHGSKGCFSRRNTLEKALIGGLVVCLAVSIALIISLAVVSNSAESDNSSSTDQKVCTTKECVIAAARVAQSIDFTVDPCEDFYTFACGTWMKTHVIPEDKTEKNTFNVMRDDVSVILKNILEANSTFPTEPVFLKTRTLYSSCMDLEKLDALGRAPLVDFINSMGGWPLLNTSWTPATFNLTDMLIMMRLRGYNPLVTSGVMVDSKNSSRRRLVIDQPGFGLPGRKYYLVERNDTTLVAYETLIHQVAVALGATPDDSTFKQAVTDIVDFEIQLANISVAAEDRRDSEALYNPYTIPELAQNFSGKIDWPVFFQGIFSHEEVQVDLAEDEIVINRSPQYLQRLIPFLEQTDERLLANYLVWRITKNAVGSSSLSQDFRDIYQQFSKVLFGTAIPPARYQKCTGSVANMMGLSLGNMFVKQAFNEEAKKLALEMITDLKHSFDQIVNDIDWMDDDTKIVAKEKNEFIAERIGYPDDILNITYLDVYYENITFNADSFFENRLHYNEQASRHGLRQLRVPVDKKQWLSAPSTVNAFYSASTNQIKFPAGILQPPFYSSTYPRSLNFGGIGVVIGHEITHGFDDRGRQYDKYGNLEQWWTDEIIQRFKERAQCIIDQYGNFTVPEADMKLNGVNTQGENIADNGGLKQSYRAYRNWVARRGSEEDLLPGLNYTNNQLFFINFAQIWCSNMRKQGAVQRILTGVHSPGRFRVIGSLQNSEDFAQAFNCPKGRSYMNPAHKCAVW